MKKLHLVVTVAVLLLPSLASAQNAFDGTWKVELKNAQFAKKPDVFVLQNGMYACKTCTPPYDIKADGQDQAVTGHPYFDTVAIKVVNDRTIEETDKKNGKVVTTSKTTVARDGKTATIEFSDSSNTNSAPITGKGVIVRVDKGPAGAHEISGSWRVEKMDTLSDNGLMFTFKVSGDELSMTSPTGQSYTAKMDGTEAPYKGDPGTTSVSVKKLAKNTVEETDIRDGKPISVNKMTVSADGKTMKIMVDDKLRNTTSEFEAKKM